MKASIFLALVVGIVLDGLIVAQSQPQLNLMPMPASVQQGSGALPITSSFSVSIGGAHDASLEAAVHRFEHQLSRQTGIPFQTKAGATATLTRRVSSSLRRNSPAEPLRSPGRSSRR